MLSMEVMHRLCANVLYLDGDLRAFATLCTASIYIYLCLVFMKE
jgi:hypothetical protein